MPGGDAVRAALELLLLEPAAGVEEELELELLHAATASAAVATAAMAGARSRCDLFIECLLSRGIPGIRLPGSAAPRARLRGGCCPARMPGARQGRRRARDGREAIALRPGFLAGR